MKTHEQTKGLSLFEHGISVKNYLFDIINHLRYNTGLKYDWDIPSWLIDNKDLILKSLPDDKTLKLYTIFHDCGKWKSMFIDSDGKKHFPDHAKNSYEIFKDVFDNQIAADLILNDMYIHLLKSSNIDKFISLENPITLLLTGLAEIHSNASMFGGKRSTSFLIKRKQIFKKGKLIIEKIKNKQ